MKKAANELRKMTKEDVIKYIKFVLRRHDKKGKDKIRFEMSGYSDNTGDCSSHNINIVNLFAHLGIYDCVSYLFLEFYKGCGTLYYRHYGQEHNHEEDLCGYGTVEIIYYILSVTILREDLDYKRTN
jgi:hypothetical protein